MISYELAKKLKDAGFQDCDLWKGEVGEYLLPYPTLSELIEACGSKFLYLLNDNNKWAATSVDYIYHKKGYLTPEEAVANLWLAINNKDESGLKNTDQSSK